MAGGGVGGRGSLSTTDPGAGAGCNCRSRCEEGPQVYSVVCWRFGCGLVGCLVVLISAIVFVVCGNARPLLLSPCNITVHLMSQAGLMVCLVCAQAAL